MSKKDIKLIDLKATLSAVGKSIFVSFYYEFKDKSISNNILANKIYNENSASKSNRQNFRIPRARRIFQMGQQLEALKIIIQSKRVDLKARELAKYILEKETLEHQYTQEICEEYGFIQELNHNMIYNLNNQLSLPQYDNTIKPAKELLFNVKQEYPRDRKISENALKIASYLCEANKEHFVFRRKFSNLNYTEPHHLIPIFARKDFPNVDLDREQNIISLCSNCHNLIHYGADNKELLKFLYEQRKDLLASVGIIISFDKLMKYY